MSNTPAMSIYESTFAHSNKTDAILVVDGKKLHVNKAFLSFHSDYFNTLFNSNFAEKSMPEIPIKDVNYEDLAAVLSLVHPYPIKPTESNCERLLELAEQFLLLPAVKNYLELFIMNSTKDRMDKIRIGDKYQLDDLRDQGIQLYTAHSQIGELTETPEFRSFSDMTKHLLFNRLMSFEGY